MGSAEAHAGHLEQAQKTLHAGLAIGVTLGQDNLHMAFGEERFADVMSSLGKIDVAQMHWLRAIEIYERIGNDAAIQSVRKKLDGHPL